VTAAKRLLGDVLQDHRRADAVGSDQHSVVAAFDEIEAKNLLDCLAIDVLGPSPVEVDHGFGGADVGVAGSALEAALLPLALLDGEHFSELGLVDDLIAAADQAEQSEGFEASSQFCGGQVSGHGCSFS